MRSVVNFLLFLTSSVGVAATSSQVTNVTNAASTTMITMKPGTIVFKNNSNLTDPFCYSPQPITITAPGGGGYWADICGAINNPNIAGQVVWHGLNNPSLTVLVGICPQMSSTPWCSGSNWQVQGTTQYMGNNPAKWDIPLRGTNNYNTFFQFRCNSQFDCQVQIDYIGWYTR